MEKKKIVIAVDSFKGTMTAIEVCESISEGIKAVAPETEIIELPIADGGEGTLETLLYAMKGDKINIVVNDPYMNKIESYYGIVEEGKTAIIEMALSSGLILVGENKNPMKTTTYGMGEMILDALDKGCRNFIVGIGGSATNDGGIGMASALGVNFTDEYGKEISLNGEGLSSLYKIDISKMDSRIEECRFTVACDVDNPLYGINGAAHIYGPQKGATPQMVEILDNNLKRYAMILNRDIQIVVDEIPGSGAAGGLGAGLVAFFDAKLKSGIDMVLDMYHFDQMIENVDIVFTGEGRIDNQSVRGKVPIGVAKRAKKFGIPVIAIVGEISEDIDEIFDYGISTVFSINLKAEDLNVSRYKSKKNLTKTTEYIFRLMNVMSK